jgi:hypothetical protein
MILRPDPDPTPPAVPPGVAQRAALAALATKLPAVGTPETESVLAFAIGRTGGPARRWTSSTLSPPNPRRSIWIG